MLINRKGENAAPRLKELAKIVKRYGKPWYAKMGVDKRDFDPVTEDWCEQC